MFYKTDARTSVENNIFIKFSLSASTYSIDDFNAKIKVVVLQQRQEWVPSQIKNVRLVIPEHKTFMVWDIVFIALGIADKHFEKTALIKSTLPLGSYKTPWTWIRVGIEYTSLTQLVRVHCQHKYEI